MGEADERVEELETNVKEMRRTVELNELRVVDGERKVKVCENDIKNIQGKATTYEERVTVLEELIQGHGKRLEELEESEGAAGDREALHEEQVDFLTQQLKETEVRADAAERMNAVLNNFLLEAETEIAAVAKKSQDMEDTMVVMDNLADDPTYDLSKRGGGSRASSVVTSAKDMWGAKDVAAEAESRSSSRSSSRAGRNTNRTPKVETPEPAPAPAAESESEEESEEEEEEEEEEAPAPAPAPAPEPEAEESEEESEEEDSDEEESDEE